MKSRSTCANKTFKTKPEVSLQKANASKKKASRKKRKKKRKISQNFQSSFSNRCDTNVIEKITENLDEDNLSLFENMCFGELMNMPKLQFQGQLLLQLMMRMDWINSKGRLVFKINNNEAVFGPTEFFVITGLHFGQVPATKSSSKIHSELFGGKATLTVKDIEDKFESVCGEDGVQGTNALKLALLLFLYAVCLVRDKSSKKIDLQYLHAVDNLEFFNEFPWGTVAFNFLVSNLKEKFGDYLGPKAIKDLTKRGQIDVFGFSYAFQAWAYEAIPQVGRICATRKEDADDLWPRILRWQSNRKPTSDEVSKIMYNEIGQVEVLSRITPSEFEMSSHSFEDLGQFESLAGCSQPTEAPVDSGTNEDPSNLEGVWAKEATELVVKNKEQLMDLGQEILNIKRHLLEHDKMFALLFDHFGIRHPSREMAEQGEPKLPKEAEHKMPEQVDPKLPNEAEPNLPEEAEHNLPKQAGLIWENVQPVSIIRPHIQFHKRKKNQVKRGPIR